MASAEPQIFRKQKLPRPLCPRLAETGTYTCGCGQVFENHTSLMIHQEEHNRITTHLRPALSLRSLEHPSILTRPSPSQLLIGLTTHSCCSCGKSFTTLQGLHQHEGKMHVRRGKASECSACGEKYANKYSLKFHVQRVHEQSPRICCEFCKQPFYDKYVKKKHILKCQDRIKLRDDYCKNAP